MRYRILHEQLTHLRKNALQPDPAEIPPVDPLTNQPFSGNVDEVEDKVQL